MPMEKLHQILDMVSLSYNLDADALTETWGPQSVTHQTLKKMRQFQEENTEKHFPMADIEECAEAIPDNAAASKEANPWIQLRQGVWMGRTDLLPAKAENIQHNPPDPEEEAYRIKQTPPEVPEVPGVAAEKIFKAPELGFQEGVRQPAPIFLLAAPCSSTELAADLEGPGGGGLRWEITVFE